MDMIQHPSAPHDGAVPRAAEHSFLDAWTYFSPELYEAEMRRVFVGGWIFVGDERSIPNAGDHLSEFVGLEPVIVLRGDDGVVRAFSNVCPHRAAMFTTGSGNCGAHLVCPYHAWSFNLDGSLAGRPLGSRFHDDGNVEGLSLTPIRLEQWDRWMFVNVSGDAPPLLDYLGPLPELFSRHRMGEMTLGPSVDDQVDVNWKIMMDNAFCDYHVTQVHGRSIGRFGALSGATEEASEHVAVLTMPWYGDRLDGVRPELTPPGSAGSIGGAVFPNFHVIGFPTGGVTVMWWTPVRPFETRARVLSYSLDPSTDPRSSIELLELTQQEDYDICRKVQNGLRSALYRPGPQNYYELRVGAFQRWLSDQLERTNGVVSTPVDKSIRVR